MLNNEKQSWQLLIGRILFVIYCLLLIGAILFKLPFNSHFIDHTRAINLIPYMGSFDDKGKLMWTEIVLNVIFFMPLGIYMMSFLNKRNIKSVIELTVIVSLVFECIQYIFAIGRSDITDVVNNTLGGILGIISYYVLKRIAKEKANAWLIKIAFMMTVLVLVIFIKIFIATHFGGRILLI